MRAFLSLPLFAACGGGDPPVLIDAPQNPGICRIAGDYGDVGTVMGTTSLGATTSTIVLDPGPPRDTFFLRLDTRGVFAGGLQTGTFTVEGAELATNTCGLCVNLLADIGNMGPEKFYFADSGTVMLTSTNPPAGTVTNVTMHEVTAGGEPIDSGCVASIDAMSFTTVDP